MTTPPLQKTTPREGISYYNSTVPFLFLISLFLIALKVYFTGKVFIIEDEAYYWFWASHPEWGYPEHPPMVAWLIALFRDWVPANEFFRFWDVRLPGVLLSLILFFIAYDWGARLESGLPRGKLIWPGRPLSPTGTVLASLMIGIPYYFGSFFLITPDTPLVFFFFLTLYFYYRGIFERPVFFYPGGICLGLGMLSKLNIFLPLLGLAAFFLTSRLTRTRFLPSRLRIPVNRRYLRNLFLSVCLGLVIFLPYLGWNVQHGFPVLDNLSRLMYQGTDWFSFFRFWGEQTLLYFPPLFPFLLILPFIALIGYWKSSSPGIGEEKKYFLALASALPLLYFFYKSTQANLRINWMGAGLVGSTVLLAMYLSETLRGKLIPLLTTSMVLITLTLGVVFYIVGNKFEPLRPVETKIKEFYPKYDIFLDSYLIYDFFQTEFRHYYQNEMRKDLPVVSPNYQLPSLVNYYVRPQTEAFGEASRENYHLIIYYFLFQEDYPGKLRQPYYLLLRQGREPDETVLRWEEYGLTPRKVKTFYPHQNRGRAYDLYLIE